jgi:hypothetical protein
MSTKDKIMAAQNRTGQYAEKAQQSYEEARGRMGEAYHQTEELVKQNPGSSALVTFGIGFGLGLLLTTVLSSSRRQPAWYEDYVPEMPSRDDISRAVSKAISQYLPASLRHRM